MVIFKKTRVGNLGINLEVTSDSIIFIVIEVSNLDIDLVDYFELLLYICEWVSIKILFIQWL
jgi:hypothetical protein